VSVESTIGEGVTAHQRVFEQSSSVADMQQQQQHLHAARRTEVLDVVRIFLVQRSSAASTRRKLD